jgi:L-asparaginase/Glu-tRNA(Gln) amidotransferase subunit D
LTSSSDGSTKDLKQLAEKDNDNTGDCNDIRTDSDDDRNKHRYPLEMTNKDFQTLMGTSLQPPAGRLVPNLVDGSEPFIPQIRLHENDGRDRKRVLVLCTGGTLTMAPDPSLGGALKPVQGALSNYMSGMTELQSPAMPDITLHEYAPFVDSSDLGPADWKRLATDIRDNYWYYDGFVIITGTDTMAYCATALSFMLENLSKPVVFTGSQIPLCEPYNDARRNLVMAIIFASREHGINEVTIFFHDRLLRACRSTKVSRVQVRQVRGTLSHYRCSGSRDHIPLQSRF